MGTQLAQIGAIFSKICLCIVGEPSISRYRGPFAGRGGGAFWPLIVSSPGCHRDYLVPMTCVVFTECLLLYVEWCLVDILIELFVSQKV